MKVIDRNTLLTVDDAEWVRPLVLKISRVYFRKEKTNNLSVILRTEPCEKSINETTILDINTNVDLDKSLRVWDSDSQIVVGHFVVRSIEVAQDPQREDFGVIHVDFDLRHTLIS